MPHQEVDVSQPGKKYMAKTPLRKCHSTHCCVRKLPCSFHRTTECCGLEGTFRGHQVQPPAVSRDIFNRIRLLRVPSNLSWKVPRDGASTTSLGNPFQCFTTLIFPAPSFLPASIVTTRPPQLVATAAGNTETLGNSKIVFPWEWITES